MARTALTAAVRRALRALGSPSAGQTLVVGLSGGPDSVALADALAEAASEGGFRVVAGHLDHALRPGSREDAVFCVDLCGRLGIPLRVGVADVRGRARRDGGGLEEAARIERYAFLRAVMREEGASAIAVAHTRDDQAETLLMRLLRGSGSRGLSGMRPRSGDVVRPLLDVSRAEVLEHLRRRRLPWREDPTNADLSLLRNRVRRELIPYLESRFNPKARIVLARTAALLGDEATVLGELGEALYLGSSGHERGGIVLGRETLRSAPPAVARIAIRRAIEAAGGLKSVGAQHVDRILALASAEAPSGRKLPLPGGRVATFSFDQIRIGPRVAPPESFAYPLPVPGRVTLPGGLVVVARRARGPVGSRGEAAIVAAPAGPLVVRTRRPGDRVQARGRDISLRRFLMQRRVPAGDRASLPVVAAGDHVVWVPGEPVESVGPADRFLHLELERRAAREEARA
jgi:tRNA(Ile)-lysidine synthase